MAKLDQKEVSGQVYILEELRSIRSAVRRMEFGNGHNREMELQRFRHPSRSFSDIDICLGNLTEDRIAITLGRAIDHPELDGARIVELEPGHKHLLADAKTGANLSEIDRMLRSPRAHSKRSLSLPLGERTDI